MKNVRIYIKYDDKNEELWIHNNNEWYTRRTTKKAKRHFLRDVMPLLKKYPGTRAYVTFGTKSMQWYETTTKYIDGDVDAGRVIGRC